MNSSEQSRQVNVRSSYTLLDPPRLGPDDGRDSAPRRLDRRVEGAWALGGALGSVRARPGTHSGEDTRAVKAFVSVFRTGPWCGRASLATWSGGGFLRAGAASRAAVAIP